LLWFKTLLDKGNLVCVNCGSRNFVRTDGRKPQGELMSEVIEKHTISIKELVDNEVN